MGLLGKILPLQIGFHYRTLRDLGVIRPRDVVLLGGLDSSALLTCLDLAGELHAGVRCVSVDFGGDLTERPWIEAAAAHHHLHSRIENYTPAAFRADIQPMMWHLEGPIGGLMNCALAPVMAAAREDGITVILDGTGLDEAFGGYRNHHSLYLGLALRDGADHAEQAVDDYAQNWEVSPDHARAAAKAALTQPGTAIDGTIPVRPELLDAGLAAHYRPTTAKRTGDPFRDALIDYLQVRKIPRNTRMKDRLSMAYGLELRLPFLDHRLVEFALSLPPRLLFLRGRSKSIVREALAGVMDDGVRVAAKRSIQAPQGPWGCGASRCEATSRGCWRATASPTAACSTYPRRGPPSRAFATAPTTTVSSSGNGSTWRNGSACTSMETLYQTRCRYARS